MSTFTTLEEAAKFCAATAGLELPRQQQAANDYVNDIREEWYDSPKLEWLIPYSVPVRCFKGRKSGFKGLTLPPEVINVMGVMNDTRPTPVVDRWGIYPHDAEWDNAQTNQATDMGDGYVWEQDPASDCYTVAFLPRNPEDAGKKLTIRFLDELGRDREEELTLKDTWVTVPYYITHVKSNGISIEAGRKGQVLARTCDGVDLAVYQPWEIVPNFRRYALNGDFQTGCQVACLCDRSYIRLTGPSDVVETNKKRIWEDGVRFLILHRKSNADKGDVTNAAKYYTAMMSKLMEEARMRRGKTKRDAIRFRGYDGEESRLFRKRGSHYPGRDISVRSYSR